MTSGQLSLFDAPALPGAAADGETAKANYMGNKRRLASYIAGKFPETGKTVVDPMCGCSAVLIEAAKRGYRVKGNDLSIVAYWYSKGVFEGTRLTDEDVNGLAESSPRDGWLTNEWEGLYPRPKAVRRYLDGVAKAVREMRGAKGWAARASFSALLQTMYSEIAIAPIAVRVGASRGRCNRLWCALSPVNFFSRNGYAISSPNTIPMDIATQNAAGMVWCQKYSSHGGKLRARPSVHIM